MSFHDITRRDFLNGVAVGAAGLAAAWLAETHGLAQGAPYPPALTGLRGSHEGTDAIAHELRDGAFWRKGREATDTGERYDLVVVGGGISGLAAAHFFRARAGRRARILILDNHDDFGGHARRNEFAVDGRLVIGFGGTALIESPAPYSREARGLMTALGIDPVALDARAHDRKLYRSLGLRRGIFFDRETFGSDHLAVGVGDRPWGELLGSAPLSPAARRDIARIEEEKIDYMPGLTAAAKKARLRKTSYKDFLLTHAKVDPQVATFYQKRTHDLYGVGIDAVPALEAWNFVRLPGFQGMKLGPVEESPEAARYRFHFPDGNATIARLLVRALNPAVVPGSTVEDVVTSRVDYGRLDEPGVAVRIRLGSLAVRARHVEPERREVEVAYIREGRVSSVRGAACILACWNSVIPGLCPDLPEEQREALVYGAKVPLVYTNVALGRWTAFAKLGVRAIDAPGSYFNLVQLDQPTRIGKYLSARLPDEPTVIHLLRTPCQPGLPSRMQHRAGRVELLATPFATFERTLRDQLARMLGAGGFDPARDIVGITVNRWPHGYAYEYNSLWDPDWPEDKKPCVLARKPFGRITIANSDAGAYAYTDSAIDQAWRAVNELPGLSRP
ncbi:MAG: NAD(P)-binding protein, partial [Vicinamibacterales bacterium]